METATPPRTVNVAERAPADVESFTTIAEDRLEGAAAIGRFIDPKLTLREVRRLLEQGHYPCWREGRVYVASKSAMLAHWRAKTAQPKGGQSLQSLRTRACGAAIWDQEILADM